jgi:branched-chain amino acid transport system substrate-binding protein
MAFARTATATITAALALACGACAAEAAEKSVDIGIVTARTGPLAAPGKFQQNGFALAAEELNRSGGVRIGNDTYQITLKTYDTRCNAAEGASAMQRLASVDHVPVVLGEVCSPAAAAEAPVASDYSIPLILTVPTSPDLTRQDNAFLFRVNADTDQLNATMVSFIAENHWSPLAFIAWNNDAGRSGVNGMKAMLPKDIAIGYVGYFDVGAVDFSADVTNIRKSGARAVMLLMDEEPGALAIRQIRDAGLETRFVGTLAMGSDRFLKRLDAKYLDGMVQYNAFPPGALPPRIQEFGKTYRTRFGEEAHGFAAQSYDGLMLAVKAMQTAGTVTDGAAIQKALSAITFDGVIGRIQFDRDRQAHPPVYITQWCKDGTRKIDFPADMKSDCGAG